jgi:uncharacterized membrane protein (UPF0127 family)
MWGMQFAIDACFLKSLGGGTFEVLSVRVDLKPWKWLPVAHWRADAVLEIPASSTYRLGIKKGMLLCIS